ncbi:MAG TPA: methionine--tRNA ligase [Chloroflexota bacterium]|jgi:methionyl-tRNA synthetase
MSDNAFYLTTPIYYANAVPSAGSTYTTLIADLVTRYHRLFGQDARMLTGTDEHGDKVARAAAAAGVSPYEYVTRISDTFRDAWTQFGIEPSDFIRTTEPRHMKVVQQILQTVYDKGEIYFGEFGGLYCYGCERFYTEKELVDGKCPQHLTVPTFISEKNYFFRMSAYQDWLIDLLETQPDRLRPDQYRREVLGFLREPLEDLCISRPTSRLTWGIPLPFDPDFVTYVWFDALINYVSALNPPDDPLYKTYWPVGQHLIGKDILKPHGVYWPCMLKAAGIPLFQHLNVHGYWTMGGQKGSKSVDASDAMADAMELFRKPVALTERYGVDGARYLMAREMIFGQDSEFSPAGLQRRYNADLANDLGNLANRVVTMLNRYCGGIVPDPSGENETDRDLRDAAIAAPDAVRAAIEAMQPHQALAEGMSLIKRTNSYLEQKAPWSAAKAGDQAGVEVTLYYAGETLGIAAALLSPAMPTKMAALREALGLPPARALGGWGHLEPGTRLGPLPILFPRIEE